MHFDQPDRLGDTADPGRVVSEVGTVDDLSDGIEGGAIGVTDGNFLVFDDDPHFLDGDGLTLELWIRPTAELPPDSCVLLFSDTRGDPADVLSKRELDAGLTSAGGTTRMFFSSRPDEAQPFTASVNLSVGVWTHLTFTWDYTQVRAYQDKLLQATGPVLGPPDPRRIPWGIGASPDGFCPFAGDIDELKLSAHVKTYDDIVQSIDFDKGGG
jgi:hypothetical protein